MVWGTQVDSEHFIYVVYVIWGGCDTCASSSEGNRKEAKKKTGSNRGQRGEREEGSGHLPSHNSAMFKKNFHWSEKKKSPARGSKKQRPGTAMQSTTTEPNTNSGIQTHSPDLWPCVFTWLSGDPVTASISSLSLSSAYIATLSNLFIP